MRLLHFLHTKYTSFVSCGCREEDFFMYFHFKSMVDGVSCMDPRGIVGKIYKEEYYTPHTIK